MVVEKQSENQLDNQDHASDEELTIANANNKSERENKLKTIEIVNDPWKDGWKVTSVMENEEDDIHINFNKKVGNHIARLVPGK